MNRDEVLDQITLDVTRVEDVPIFGTVHLRPYPEGLRCQRMAEVRPGNSQWRAQRVIDLVVDDKGEPIFTQDDLLSLVEADSYKLDGINLAIQKFLESHQKKNQPGSAEPGRPFTPTPT